MKKNSKTKKNDGATDIWDSRYDKGGTAVTEIGNVGDPIDYTSHPFIWKESIAKTLTGDFDGDPNLELGQRIFKTPAKNMLAIGSGLAGVEEWYVICGFVENCVAYEASQVAVDKANERIKNNNREDKIQVICGDVLDADIPDETYDVVFVQAAIHHFFEIEEMYKFMHRVLKPGGLLLFDEYVGPDHLIFDDFTLDLMDEIDSCLSEKYRFDSPHNEFRTGVRRPTLKQMIEMDPSEGVHSSHILPLTYQYFEIIERLDYGGTILRPFFTGILNNFNFEKPEDQTIIRLIVLLEKLLTKHSIIQHSNTRIVARKRLKPRKPLTAKEKARIAYEDWPGLDK